ncbi:hypothetical protein RUMCAL_02024 [Ruminococcus callidus ATCC 27760]|uniref:Uncharacterized protein n=1 Tax=Ruminococcus callidus ATCC 27760 TaxID=411473 RepID=U2K7Z9_9FIRM|nr:hypothetical protein RUMCAL_02024 [Ruminococcus callidus ATCC 27760]
MLSAFCLGYEKLKCMFLAVIFFYALTVFSWVFTKAAPQKISPKVKPIPTDRCLSI